MVLDNEGGSTLKSFMNFQGLLGACQSITGIEIVQSKLQSIADTLKQYVNCELQMDLSDEEIETLLSFEGHLATVAQSVSQSYSMYCTPTVLLKALFLV